MIARCIPLALMPLLMCFATLAFANGGAVRIDGALRASGPLPDGVVVLAFKLGGDGGEMFQGEVADGGYVLNLAAGDYIIGAKAPGWASLQHSLTLPGPNSRLDLLLHREQGSDPQLAAEFEAMEAADQEVRNRWIAARQDPALGREVALLDASNEARVRDIIRSKGWPGAELVGGKAAKAVWLLVQHGSASLLKQCLPYMKTAAEKGELPWASVALSVDRDLMYDGKKQRYGSQFQTNQLGKQEMYSVEDEAHLDARRAQMGLGPIADYKALLLKLHAAPAEK
ncbi:DUF6624 domain-containing protein [Janthinobacterium fluminis]|uniref:Carboxypeptidase regulatory-like domain-containing protein n=1 Tax=Janthinobacterium fluminis TaxID=2987524 RepID=A0ABT5JWG8_9BURK|nr:DUF6624 domain-containing protein [Janthinobacterium fluminis]MDC8757083.1 hypothetical protein [Janthinobacterium fluminis]